MNRTALITILHWSVKKQIVKKKKRTRPRVYLILLQVTLGRAPHTPGTNSRQVYRKFLARELIRRPVYFHV